MAELYGWLCWRCAVCRHKFAKRIRLLADHPDTQLLDNGDGTVSDGKSGLMWKQCSEGQSGSDCAVGSTTGFSWQGVLQQAQTVNASGFAVIVTGGCLPSRSSLLGRMAVRRACHQFRLAFPIHPIAITGVRLPPRSVPAIRPTCTKSTFVMGILDGIFYLSRFSAFGACSR